MHTKEDAEAVLAALPVKAPIVVTDTTDAKTGKARRSYAFVTAGGSEAVVEIDAEPSDRQLGDLSRHLPLDAKDQAAALVAMKASTPVKGGAAEEATPEKH